MHFLHSSIAPEIIVHLQQWPIFLLTVSGLIPEYSDGPSSSLGYLI